MHSEPEAENDEKATDRERDEVVQSAHVERAITAIERISKQLDRAEDQNSPKNKSERRWKRWEVIGLWAAALAGPVVAVFAIIIGNHAATQQLKIAVDSEQKQLRAYVFSVIETPLTDFSAGEKRYSVVFANGGTTPAYDPFFKLWADFIPLPFTMPVDQYSAEIDQGRGPPGDYLFKEHTKSYKSASFVLTPEKSDAVKDGKGGVFLFGGMSYTDIFGCRHHVHFCVALYSQRGSTPAPYECGAFNDVDDPNTCEKDKRLGSSPDLP